MKVANKLTTEDLQAIGDLLDKQTAVLATKEELRAQTIELKTYMQEGVETVTAGMDDLEKRLDVRDRVDKLEKDVHELKFKR